MNCTLADTLKYSLDGTVGVGHDYPPAIRLTIGCDPAVGGCGPRLQLRLARSAQLIKPTGTEDKITGAS